MGFRDRATVVCFALVLALAAESTRSAAREGLSIRITSPLGRTGLPGPIRIVAQVRPGSAAPLGQVRFFVDEELLGTVNSAPYAIEWVDKNPFERREIIAEALDASGNSARDRVVLEPFEVTEAAEVASVLLEASVQDGKGRFVKNLPPTAFTVAEDGKPQRLDIVRQEAVGATFALLVDSSGSMSRRIDFVQRTAVALAGYMTERDRMLIAPFSKTIGATTGPTNDRTTITEAINAIKSSGGTAILDAVEQAARMLQPAEGRRALVLITDGYDEHSTIDFEGALEAVRKAQVTVYVVGIGGVAGISLKGERLLRRLATETGGRFFFPSTDVQLATVHDTLTEDVQNRYLITYTPTNQRVDGTWRVIDVATSPADYVVKTRPGYFAPKPPPIRPNIEFTALDSSGRYLDLTAEDLEVLENGELQQVDTFQEAVEPVSIVLALDASGSMRRKEAELMESAQRFVNSLRPEDSLALVMFSDKVVFAHDLSKNRQFSQDAIAEYRALGGTALYDAVADSLIRLKRANGRRVVVVMTDGRDENNPGTGPGSVRSFDDVLKHLRESGGAAIFGIGLGTNVDQGPLQRLADLSGGRALFPADIAGLAAEFRRVSEDLRRRYVVGYTSSHIQRDGSWREVVVRVKDKPDASIRTAGGYFAPAK
jgi:VWFA-related protein